MSLTFKFTHYEKAFIILCNDGAMCAICISSVVGRLIIDAGILENVNLKILSDGELYVNNGGIIKKNKKFYTSTNAKVLINNGVVN